MATSYNWEDRGAGGAHASEQFISVLNVPNPSGTGTLQFNVRDEMARGQLQSILDDISSGVNFIGICTDPLTDTGDASHTNPIHISGMADTVTAEAGDIVIVRKDSYSPKAKQDKEFIWSGPSDSGKWNLFGEVNIEDFGELAWLNASNLQTASNVVTGTTLNKAATTSTGAVEVLDSVSAELTSGTVAVTGTITPGAITQGTVTPSAKFIKPEKVVKTITSAELHNAAVGVTGTITPGAISQGAVTQDKKYITTPEVVKSVDSAELNNAAVGVTGTITPGAITQGTDNSTYGYMKTTTVATEGVVLSANATTETLTFTTATKNETVYQSAAKTDTGAVAYASAVALNAPSMASITYNLEGTVTDKSVDVTTTPGTGCAISDTTSTGATAVVTNVSVADPTMASITHSLSGTVTDKSVDINKTDGDAYTVSDATSTGATKILQAVSVGNPTMASITHDLTGSVGKAITVTPTKAYIKTVDTASKVGIEKKSS